MNSLLMKMYRKLPDCLAGVEYAFGVRGISTTKVYVHIEEGSYEWDVALDEHTVYRTKIPGITWKELRYTASVSTDQQCITVGDGEKISSMTWQLSPGEDVVSHIENSVKRLRNRKGL